MTSKINYIRKNINAPYAFICYLFLVDTIVWVASEAQSFFQSFSMHKSIQTWAITIHRTSFRSIFSCLLEFRGEWIKLNLISPFYNFLKYSTSRFSHWRSLNCPPSEGSTTSPFTVFSQVIFREKSFDMHLPRVLL